MKRESKNARVVNLAPFHARVAAPKAPPVPLRPASPPAGGTCRCFTHEGARSRRKAGKQGRCGLSCDDTFPFLLDDCPES